MGKGNQLMTVLTVGTFDLFHSGHVTLLAHCRQYAGQRGRVIVGVNTGRFAGSFKPRPVQMLSERMTVIGACRYVDEVIVNDDACLEPMLLAVKPDYLVIGADWAPPRDYMAQIGTTQQWLEGHRIKLVYVPRAEDSQSTTKIRQAIESATPNILSRKPGNG
jgi:cytidyltransferase-like protein